jgi:hypothetical protein
VNHEEHLVGEFGNDSRGVPEDVDVVDEFLEDFLVDAAVEGDGVGDEVEEEDEQFVAPGGEPETVDESLEVVHDLQPQLLLRLVVDRPNVVQEAAVGVGSNPRLLDGVGVRDVGKLLVGLVLALQLDYVEVVLRLLQRLLQLLPGLHLPRELLGNKGDAGDEVEGELRLLVVLNIERSNPFRIFKQFGLILLKGLERFLQPLLGLELGVLVELQDEKGGVHGLVVVIQELVLAGTDQRLEHLHAKVIDVLRVLERVQVPPVLGVVGGRPLYYLLRLLGKSPLHSIVYKSNRADEYMITLRMRAVNAIRKSSSQQPICN